MGWGPVWVCPHAGLWVPAVTRAVSSIPGCVQYPPRLGASVALPVAGECGSLDPAVRTPQPQAGPEWVVAVCGPGARRLTFVRSPRGIVGVVHPTAILSIYLSGLSGSKATSSPNSAFTHFPLPASVSPSVEQTGLPSEHSWLLSLGQALVNECFSASTSGSTAKAQAVEWARAVVSCVLCSAFPSEAVAEV